MRLQRSLLQLLEMPSARWLLPGMLVKRWLLLAMLGIAVMFLGLLILIDVRFPEVLVWLHRHVQQAAQRLGTQGNLPWTVLGGALFLLGFGMSLVGVRGLVRTIACAIDPVAGRRLAHVIYNRRNLQLGPELVAIGGGTGLSCCCEVSSSIPAMSRLSLPSRTTEAAPVGSWSSSVCFLPEISATVWSPWRMQNPS